jgi:menaquinone-specific isochorismate synthase
MTQAEDAKFLSIPAQYGRLISTHLPCSISLSQFLRAGQGQARFYWESSRDNLAFAGIGTALEIVGYGKERFETVRHHAIELFSDALVLEEQEPFAAPRLFGGFSFTDDFVPDVAWSDFLPAHFVLPHYQLVRIGEQHWLSINAHLPYGESPSSLLPDLKEALEAKIAELTAFSAPLPPTKAADLRYPMPYEAWERMITDATTRMKNGELNKVVLSRVAELRFQRPVVLDNALAFLAEKYPETYRFLFEPRPHHAFYGASPELLATVDGMTIKTMALAGSIKRGVNPEEDDAFAQELLDSAKDRYEHELVVEGIRARLEPFTTELDFGATGVMRLSNIQHLYTPVSGKLKSNDGILPIVAAMHPTPALGGDPRDIAMKLISDYEAVPRGWYAAPVGWIDRHMNGQFGVAIRSAVAQGKRVWLYSGAGIVKDSQPQKEWDETGWKFRPMLNALGVPSS